MAALFSSGGHSGGGHHASSANLVEFRAGKMTLRERMVHPDKRKGLVYIHQSEDMLMHFCWKDRNTGNVEDDLIIFPDDTEFVPVKQCTTGRVFLLKFKSSPKRLFFWMQEPKSDKDEDHCKKVNDMLNNPPVPGSARGAGSSRGGSARGQASGGSISDQLSAINRSLGLGASEQELSALAGMDQNQLMQFLNLMGGGAGLDAVTGGLSRGMGGSTGGSSGPAITSTPTIPTPSPASSRPATAAAAPSGGTRRAPASTPASTEGAQIQLSDLQTILAGMNIPEEARGPAVELEEVLSNQNVATIASEDGNAERLIPHLPREPPINQDREELARTVRSPQFRQVAGVFGSAFQTGQLGPLVRQFGLGNESVEAANRGDIQSFAELLEQEEAPPTESTPQQSTEDKKDEDEKEPKPDGDDGMDLD